MYYDTIFDDLYRLNKELSGLFNSKRIKRSYSWPEVNCYENHDEYTAVLRMPGVKKEDLSISYKDNSIKIQGEKKIETKENVNYHLRERRAGKFERNILLQEKIETDKIEAQLENGILMIKMPKAVEAKPKNIEIK